MKLELNSVKDMFGTVVEPGHPVVYARGYGHSSCTVVVGVFAGVSNTTNSCKVEFPNGDKPTFVGRSSIVSMNGTKCFGRATEEMEKLMTSISKNYELEKMK
jgi:hypothetical protein